MGAALARTTAVLLLALLVVASFAAPRVLIYQRPIEPTPDGPTGDLMMAVHLADALGEQGRVVGVVYSEVDPAFRDALHSGLLGPFEPNPDLRRLREIATRLQCQFVLVLQAYWQDRQVHPSAELYRASAARSIWSYGPRDQVVAQSMVVMVGGVPDHSHTAASVARTWASMLNEGPFNQFVPTARTGSDQPVTPFQQGVNVGPPVGQSTDEILRDVETLVDQGLMNRAIIHLRDSIDSQPRAPELRVRLAKLLIELGLLTEAGSEAERAARLMPHDPSLWLMAADCRLFSGDLSGAENALNEALARGGEGAESLRIQGSLALRDGNYETAADRFTRSLEQGGGPEALAGRGVAYALMGEHQASERDLANLARYEAGQVLRVYRWIVDSVDQAIDGIATRLRDLPVLLRRDGAKPEHVSLAQALSARMEGIASLLVDFPAPEVHSESHDARSLAASLLYQAAVEIRSYAETGSDEMREEAEISLNEAFKLLPLARERYKIELKGTR